MQLLNTVENQLAGQPNEQSSRVYSRSLNEIIS